MLATRLATQKATNLYLHLEASMWDPYPDPNCSEIEGLVSRFSDNRSMACSLILVPNNYHGGDATARKIQDTAWRVIYRLFLDFGFRSCSPKSWCEALLKAGIIKSLSLMENIPKEGVPCLIWLLAAKVQVREVLAAEKMDYDKKTAETQARYNECLLSCVLESKLMEKNVASHFIESITPLIEAQPDLLTHFEELIHGKTHVIEEFVQLFDKEVMNKT